MSVLLTGSEGFLGQHLLRALAQDNSVFATAFPGASYPNAGPGTQIAFRYWDVREPVSDLGAADAVFHLAAMNGATSDFYEKPWQVLDTQIRGTLNVIDACVKHNVKTLVLFSSSEVYQTPPVLPTPENVPLSIPDVTNPRYSYAGGKIAAELMAWHSTIERVVIVRPHNVYGPNAGYGHVIPGMIVDMDRTPIPVPPVDSMRPPRPAPYTIKGASCTRSFIHIDDFTSAMMAIWNHTQKQTGRVREIYHVGTEDQVSITALSGYIAAILERRFSWKTARGADGETMARCPDTKKLRSLGWEPKIELSDGLKRTVADYLEKREEWPA